MVVVGAVGAAIDSGEARVKGARVGGGRCKAIGRQRTQQEGGADDVRQLVGGGRNERGRRQCEGIGQQRMQQEGGGQTTGDN